MDRFHDLDSGIAGLRNFVRSNAPDFRRMSARFGIADRTLAGKLVALLAVLASALAVALPGDHGAAGTFPSDVAGREAQVNQRQTVFNAFRLVLDSARMQHNGAVSFGKEVSGAFNGFGRYSALLSGSTRVPGANRFRYLFESRRVRRNKIAPLQAVAQNDVEQTHVQSHVRARPDGKIHVRIPADRRHAGIDNDDFSASVAATPQIVSRDRRTFRNIRARYENDLRLENVGPRQWAAVHAKRQLVRRAGRHHAQPSVVVDVARAKRNACELSEQIGFLGNQRSSAIDGNGVLAVFALHFFQASHRKVQRLVPRCLAETLRRAHQGIEQTVRMTALHVTLHALGTEHSVVERKLFPWLESDDLIPTNFELDSALLATKTTMRFHQSLCGVA